MKSLGISHQTLQQFMDAPFGKPNDAKSLKYESKYRAYRDSNKIKIESSIEYEKRLAKILPNETVITYPTTPSE